MIAIYTETIAEHERRQHLKNIAEIVKSIGLIDKDKREQYIKAVSTVQRMVDELCEIKSGRTGLRVQLNTK